MVLADGAVSTISANNLKMTDSMRDYVEDKIGTVISKFAGVAQRCDTHLSVMRNPAARLAGVPSRAAPLESGWTLLLGPKKM